MNDIYWIEKLLKVLVKVRSVCFEEYGKLNEPSISIGMSGDGEWFCEIYSYTLDFHDGGRHHYWEAKTYDELIRKVNKSLNEELEKLLKELEIKNKQED